MLVFRLTKKIYYIFLRQKRTLAILSLFGLLIYNEFLVYCLMPQLSWPEVKCGDYDKVKSVLLVADPQILGETTEPWIFRWDNDRYLKHSFATAVGFLKPQIVIFLGDLMDEGSIASDEEYSRYFVRFKEIFQLDSFGRNETFFIPGDNDIGGEDELVTERKVRRFKSHFFSPTFRTFGNIQFAQVDKMQRMVPHPAAKEGDFGGVRVVISHMPLLNAPSAFAAEVLQTLRPHLALTAHDHKAVCFAGDIETGERSLVEHMSVNTFTEDKMPSWMFRLSNRSMIEVVVPTCSYRMGVRHMGLGVALIDEGSEAWCYHVLWLPDRFLALVLDAIAVAAVLFLAFGIRSPLTCRASKTLSPAYRRL